MLGAGDGLPVGPVVACLPPARDVQVKSQLRVPAVESRGRGGCAMPRACGVRECYARVL